MTCAVAGCSVTTQLGSVFGRDKPEGTASIPSQPPPADPAVLPDAADLAVVRTAAAAMLDTGETGTQWENPATGARGTITPIASNYSQGGTQCRTSSRATSVISPNPGWKARPAATRQDAGTFAASPRGRGPDAGLLKVG
jgi:17 kDa outer membrane surface antigen